LITTTAIDQILNNIFTVLAPDASKAAIAAGLPTCEDLEYLLTYPAAEKNKVEAAFCLIFDTRIGTYIDVHRVMFLFDWSMANIVDPDFERSNFTRSVYVADKRARAVSKSAVTSPATTATTKPTVSNTINFPTDVLLADATRQATPVTPDMVATLNRHKICKLPFVAS
jgi:hypothetical protein